MTIAEDVDRMAAEKMPKLLRREGFRYVVGTSAGTYWKHRDGRRVLITKDRKGRLTLERLDQ
jgi:predicted RNA binding protein YcfA (HicA-like mRNA interferase family)